MDIKLKNYISSFEDKFDIKFKTSSKNYFIRKILKLANLKFFGKLR